MTDLEMGFLSMIGANVAGIWNALSQIVIFGMSFTTILVSALAISTVLPFFLKFLSSGSGFILSGSDSVYVYSRSSDNAKRIQRAGQRASAARAVYVSRVGAKKLHKKYEKDGN